MKIIHSASLLLFPALFAISANAQATRTWVSGVGDDVNPCSRTAPCKTFAGAISKTAPSGEINVLDPGGFGGVTITKSITIDGGSYTAGVLVSSGNGIVVAAGPNDVVTLRSLDINGLGTGVSGVNIISAGLVRVEKSRIYDFSTAAINAVPSTGTALSLVVTDSVLTNCVGATPMAVNVDATTIPVNATLDNVQIHGCGTALNAAGGSKVTARNFDFSSNTTGAAAAGASVVTLDSGVISYNTTGVQAGGTSVIRLSNNTILDNTTGLSATGGSIVSFNNNRLKGNGTDGSPTTTYYVR